MVTFQNKGCKVKDNYWKAGFSHIKGFSDGHFSK